MVEPKTCSVTPQPRSRHPTSTMDKLDQDFILFMSFAFDSLEKLKHSKHLDICKQWFNKLCSEHYETIPLKQTRNLYLSRLLLNIQDGKFNPEFLVPPPHGDGFLPFCENMSMCQTNVNHQIGPEPEPEVINQDLNMKNYKHMSEDRRTYVATRSIPNGVMSYVAVTIGGDTPQWMNKEGEPVAFPPSGNILKVATPAPTNYKLFLNQGRMYLNNEEEIREKQKAILRQRKPPAERTKLIRFYEQILLRIDEEIEQLNGKTCTENKDPFIEHLAEKLQVNLQEQKVDTVENINNAVEQRKRILELLRTNIESQKTNIFEKREYILNKLEKIIERSENVRNEASFQFIKPNEMVSLDGIDSQSHIWGSLLHDRLLPKHEAILTKKYCAQLVTLLQSLLKEDKMKIIRKAHCLARDIEAQMTQDFQNEIQKGLTKFSNGRQEWIRIQNVLKDIDRIRQVIVHEKLECEDPIQSKTKQHLLEVCAQVATMKCKLECLIKRNDDLVKQIQVILGKIHHVTEQNIACQDELNAEYERLKQCINDKLKEIQEQELMIAKLRDGTANN
uniref:DUF4485 domain-containing protein n=1 Tax=Cacopsylla melanoneura TaxID=428564 RepID=A0A8D8Z1F6_9HEMI